MSIIEPFFSLKVLQVELKIKSDIAIVIAFNQIYIFDDNKKILKYKKFMISDIEVVSLSVKCDTLCAFKFKDRIKFGRSHIIIETLKLPELINFLQTQIKEVTILFEYVKSIDYINRKGKK